MGDNRENEEKTEYVTSTSIIPPGSYVGQQAVVDSHKGNALRSRQRCNLKMSCFRKPAKEVAISPKDPSTQLSECVKLRRRKTVNYAEKQFACESCGQEFLDKVSFLVHRRTHSQEEVNSPTDCKRQCSQESDLQLHDEKERCVGPESDQRPSSSKALKKHLPKCTGERVNSCGDCENQFHAKCDLTKHGRSHIGGKVCVECNKSFARPFILKRHLRTHTGDRPYHCTHCDKKFALNGTLKEHLLIHTGEKPYACTKCDKRFRKKSGLRAHLKCHTEEKPFVCLECNKSFLHFCNFKRHLRTHTGERPHACTYCNKKFGENAALREHVRIHTGEKPYACTNCDKRFRQGSSWRAHLLSTEKGCLKRHLRLHKREQMFVC